MHWWWPLSAWVWCLTRQAFHRTPTSSQRRSSVCAVVASMNSCPMYGKHFAQTYTGSMFGAGPVVFAVWGYVIANARRDGTVEVNAQLVAAAPGAPGGGGGEGLGGGGGEGALLPHITGPNESQQRTRREEVVAAG